MRGRTTVGGVARSMKTSKASLCTSSTLRLDRPGVLTKAYIDISIRLLFECCSGKHARLGDKEYWKRYVFQRLNAALSKPPSKLTHLSPAFTVDTVANGKVALRKRTTKRMWA